MQAHVKPSQFLKRVVRAYVKKQQIYLMCPTETYNDNYYIMHAKYLNIYDIGTWVRWPNQISPFFAYVTWKRFGRKNNDNRRECFLMFDATAEAIESCCFLDAHVLC